VVRVRAVWTEEPPAVELEGDEAALALLTGITGTTPYEALSVIPVFGLCLSGWCLRSLSRGCVHDGDKRCR
jgi:hypothetical protein